MLNNLKLRFKLLLFPALFILVIMVVSLAFFRGNDRSKDLLTRINLGYVPYQETAILLRGELDNLQRSMQDAVASADESMLEESNSIFESISVKLQTVESNIVGKDNEDINNIRQQIDS